MFLFAAAGWTGGADWDSPSLWTIDTDGQSRLTLSPETGIGSVRLRLNYSLQGPDRCWVGISHPWVDDLLTTQPLTFLFRADSQADLEVLVRDRNGSQFVCRFPLKMYPASWEPVVLYKDSFLPLRGAGDRWENPQTLSLRVTGSAETGWVSIDEIGPGRPGIKPTAPPDAPQWDENWNRPGWGTRARRDRRLQPENPSLRRWLSAQQDAASLEKRLIPSMEDNIARTEYNAQVALAFLVIGERERAERILDFFAQAMDPANANYQEQNFYVNGQPLGFFCDAFLTDCAAGAAFDAPRGSRRGLGDMAWLYLAAAEHGVLFGTGRYSAFTSALSDHVAVRLKNVESFERVLTDEEALACWAVLRREGAEDLARALREWLWPRVNSAGGPLAVYAGWALLNDSAEPLKWAEGDRRYRKTISVGKKDITGFFLGPLAGADNIWVEGLGRMSCAYFSVGDTGRAHYYANQMDRCWVDSRVDGQVFSALPYSLNTEGQLRWARPDRGFASTAAWYIFAKNKFNPYRLVFIEPRP